MPLNCSELTTLLKSLKALQSRLNLQIEEFDSVKNDDASERADKISILKKIYQTRKGIKEIVKSDIIFDIDSNWNELDHVQKLANILQSIELKKPLNKIQLTYLYNIDNDAAFKNQELKSIRESRDKNADMLVIFDCQPNQIVHNQEELDKAHKDQIEIKAFVGELFSNIFKLLPEDIEHIYTEFPEGKIKQKTIELGTGLKIGDDFMNALEKKGFPVKYTPFQNAKILMDQPGFSVATKETLENIVILTVAKMGLKDGGTIQEIYDKAGELGLELCSPETGPQLRLQYWDHPIHYYIVIGMKPIKNTHNRSLKTFLVRSDGDNLGVLSSAGKGDPTKTYDGTIVYAFARRSAT